MLGSSQHWKTWVTEGNARQMPWGGCWAVEIIALRAKVKSTREVIVEEHCCHLMRQPAREDLSLGKCGMLTRILKLYFEVLFLTVWLKFTVFQVKCGKSWAYDTRDTLASFYSIFKHFPNCILALKQPLSVVEFFWLGETVRICFETRETLFSVFEHTECSVME